MTRLVSILLCFLPTLMMAKPLKDYGVVGDLYPIKEVDFRQEVKQRSAEVNWDLIQKETKEKIKAWKPEITHLPRAKEGRNFFVDMTHTTTIDVPDGKGGILYPAGTKVNPLKIINYQKTLIVIDGSDENQLRWFEQSEFFDQTQVKLLLSDGAYSQIQNRFNRPVFYVNNLIISKFELQATPSIIRQEGVRMLVEEVEVPR